MNRHEPACRQPTTHLFKFGLITGTKVLSAFYLSTNILSLYIYYYSIIYVVSEHDYSIAAV